VQARRAAGDEQASAAFEVYVHRLVTTIGARTAAAGGLDVLVFTGGVGQNSAEVRAEVGHGLAHLAVVIDPGRNASDASDRDIGAAAVRVLVVEAREDLQMVREVTALRQEGN
jgi:acetate kinase